MYKLSLMLLILFSTSFFGQKLAFNLDCLNDLVYVNVVMWFLLLLKVIFILDALECLYIHMRI